MRHPDELIRSAVHAGSDTGFATVAQVMPAHRMNRDQFFAKLADLGEDDLRKALWTLYWRGSAPVRERIEEQLAPGRPRRGRRHDQALPDPDVVLCEVRDLVGLARSGAYLAGDRRVPPKERSQWRSTFRRLATDAQLALRTDRLDTAARALELMIDLACETAGYDYFRSEDPMQAAGFVVSDAVAQLWSAVHDRRGFAEFAERAGGQLVRWEAPYGWTRCGDGTVAGKERSLGEVLAGMLHAPDHWRGVAAHYLDALDQLGAGDTTRTRPNRPAADRTREDRARALAGWHGMLLDRLADSESEQLLDRLIVSPALAGPELTFVEARLASLRGDQDRAGTLVYECLERLPGHRTFHDFAHRIQAPVPPRAAQVVARAW